MKITEALYSTIREVPDFPKAGINFKDITPVLENPELCRNIIVAFKDALEETTIDAVAGIESRGFLFGLPLAMALDVPFITIRKKGKLPGETHSVSYDLEYGTAEIEVHKSSIKPGWNVLIHDDLLATGGTANATAKLVAMEQANIAGFAFVIELLFLKGRERLRPFDKRIVTLATY